MTSALSTDDAARFDELMTKYDIVDIDYRAVDQNTDLYDSEGNALDEELLLDWYDEDTEIGQINVLFTELSVSADPRTAECEFFKSTKGAYKLSINDYDGECEYIGGEADFRIERVK